MNYLLNILFSMFFLSFSAYSVAQGGSTLEDDGTIKTDNYEFLRPAKLTRCANPDGVMPDSGKRKYLVVPKGTKFRLVGVLQSGQVVIQLWQYKDSADQVKYNGSSTTAFLRSSNHVSHPQGVDGGTILLSDTLSKDSIFKMIDSVKAARAKAKKAKKKDGKIRISVVDTAATENEHSSAADADIGSATSPMFVDSSSTYFYVIEPADWQNKVVKIYSRYFIKGCFEKGSFSGTSIVGGALLLPYKWRPSLDINGKKTGFDFSKDISFGVTGGFRQRISRFNPYYIDVLGGVGIADVTQTPYNTGDGSKGGGAKPGVSTSTNVSAISWSCGVVFDFKNIQLGAFIGWDKVSASDDNGWWYNGKPWFSVGFGYSIFTTGSAQSNASGTNSGAK